MLGFLLGALATIGFQFAWLFYQKNIEESSHRSTNSRSLINSTTGNSDKKLSSYDIVAGVSQSGFLTELVGQLWYYINLAGCQIVKDSVEPMFAKLLPTPLNTLHFSKLDLGIVPIRLDNIVVHQVDLVTKTVQFELDVLWDGECDIQLKADYIGSLGVRHVKLMGRMSVILLPLIDKMPIVQAVQYSFINPPTIALDFTGLAQIADVKLIDTSVRNVIQSVLQGMVVLPNRMCTKLDSAVKFYDICKPPLGVARLTVKHGAGFTAEKSTIGKDDIRDVYLKIEFGTISWTTSIQKDTAEPVWNEVSDVLLYDYDQILYIQAWDSDSSSFDSDDILGYGHVTVGELVLSTGRTRTISLFDKEDTRTGATVTLSASICQLTTKSLASYDTFPKTSSTNTTTALATAGSAVSQVMYGLVSIIISNVNNIPIADEKEALCSVKVDYGKSGETGNNIVTYETSPIAGLNPTYDVAYAIPVTKNILYPSDITLTLLSNPTAEQKKKQKDAKPTVLGTVTVTHQELLTATSYTITGTRPIGTSGSSTTIDFQVKLCGLDIPAPPTVSTTSTSTTAVNTAPTGTTTTTATTAVGGDVITTALTSTGSKEEVSFEVTLDTNEESAMKSANVDSGASSSNYGSTDDSKMSVNLSILSGRGFQIESSPYRIKKDIPDVYVKVQFGPLPEPWKTAIVNNSTTPVWTNETKRYDLVHYGMMIVFDVWDNDQSTMSKLSGSTALNFDEDDFLGTARISVGKLLLAGGGSIEIELLDKSGTKGTGAYITIACEKVQV